MNTCIIHALCLEIVTALKTTTSENFSAEPCKNLVYEPMTSLTFGIMNAMFTVAVMIYSLHTV